MEKTNKSNTWQQDLSYFPNPKKLKTNRMGGVFHRKPAKKDAKTAGNNVAEKKTHIADTESLLRSAIADVTRRI